MSLNVSVKIIGFTTRPLLASEQPRLAQLPFNAFGDKTELVGGKVLTCVPSQPIGFLNVLFAKP